VVTEAKSLKRNTQQQQKPTPLLQKGFKKRVSANPDQDGSRKRRKAAQFEENQLPEFTASSQVDTDLIEDLIEDSFPPVAADTDRQSRFIERSRGVMEMRWKTSRRDGGSHSDGKDGDNDGDNDDDDDDGDGDEEDKDGNDKDEDKEDNDRDEEDNDGDEEDRDGDEEDNDEDEPPFYDSEIPGISNWDLLGEDFEREAATLGLYSSYELPTQLTTL
jgi:hypothetical protein